MFIYIYYVYIFPNTSVLWYSLGYTKGGAACVFPFIYKGRSFKVCADVKSDGNRYCMPSENVDHCGVISCQPDELPSSHQPGKFKVRLLDFSKFCLHLTHTQVENVGRFDLGAKSVGMAWGHWKLTCNGQQHDAGDGDDDDDGGNDDENDADDEYSDVDDDCDDDDDNDDDDDDNYDDVI